MQKFSRKEKEKIELSHNSPEGLIITDLLFRRLAVLYLMLQKQTDPLALLQTRDSHYTQHYILTPL